MMIKFLAHGTGKGSSAATYLLDSHDHKGEERAGVAVLRGDPQQFAAVADALDFQHRYRSAVISWSEEEAPVTQRSARCWTTSRRCPLPDWIGRTYT